MKTLDIIKNLDWKTIFKSSDLTQKLFDFSSGQISLKEFKNAFNSKSKNKKIVIYITENNKTAFIKHCRKIYDFANIGLFKNGDEMSIIKQYISSLK